MTSLAIVLILVAIGVFIMWFENRRSRRDGSRERQAHHKQVQAERSARVGEAYALRQAYLGTLAEAWPFRVECRVDGQNSDLLLTVDGSDVRVVPGRGGESFSAQTAWSLATADIVELRVASRTRVESVTRTRDVTTPTRNSKSPVGRAVVGGLLLGPVGAVVGAASGLKAPEPKTGTHSYEEKVEVEGLPVVMIITRDLHRPLIRLELPSKPITEKWVARLRAAMAQ